MKKVIFLLIALMSFNACGQGKTDTKKNPPAVNLHIAALQGNVVAVKQHINAGSDLNKKDEYGSTPLIAAITFGKDEAAKALIDAGADLTIANNDGSTPLHIAAFFCRTETVKALMEKGVDKEIRNNFGSTALESVAAPFEMVKPVYDAVGMSLKSVGLILDYDRLKSTRPKIAELLR